MVFTHICPDGWACLLGLRVVTPKWVNNEPKIVEESRLLTGQRVAFATPASYGKKTVVHVTEHFQRQHRDFARLLERSVVAHPKRCKCMLVQKLSVFDQDKPPTLSLADLCVLQF